MWLISHNHNRWTHFHLFIYLHYIKPVEVRVEASYHAYRYPAADTCQRWHPTTRQAALNVQAQAPRSLSHWREVWTDIMWRNLLISLIFWYLTHLLQHSMKDKSFCSNELWQEYSAFIQGRWKLLTALLFNRRCNLKTQNLLPFALKANTYGFSQNAQHSILLKGFYCETTQQELQTVWL